MAGTKVWVHPPPHTSLKDTHTKNEFSVREAALETSENWPQNFQNAKTSLQIRVRNCLSPTQKCVPCCVKEQRGVNSQGLPHPHFYTNTPKTIDVWDRFGFSKLLDTCFANKWCCWLWMLSDAQMVFHDDVNKKQTMTVVGLLPLGFSKSSGPKIGIGYKANETQEICGC